MNSKLPLPLRAGVLCAVAAVLGGCAANAPPDAGGPARPVSPAPPAGDQAGPRRPEAPALPAPGPASPAAQQQAQKMALAAVSTLEAGQEEQARAELQRALALDPQNKLALSLLRQMSEPVMAPRESFAYTVRPGDTLSSIAERYMGDKFLFYALARLNDIKVPRQLSSGQTVRVPGSGQAMGSDSRPAPRPQPPEVARRPPPREPPAVADKTAPGAEKPAPPAEKPAPVAVVAPPPAPLPPPPPPPPPPGPTPAERALSSAEAAERAGNLDQAVADLGRTAGLEAGSAMGTRQTALKKRLVGRFTSNARGAFARQDLDGAIRHWDRVLQLDPGNDNARLERQRALGLKQKVSELEPKK